MSQTYKGLLPNIRFSHTSTHEIEGIIKSLKAKHSYGYDEIPTTILKVSAPFISSPLTYIVNKSFSSGIYTTRLKFSVITEYSKLVTNIAFLITDQYLYYLLSPKFLKR
jgi:hypothetical protein